MSEQQPNILKQTLTEADNVNYAPSRVRGFLMLIIMTALQVYAMFKGQQFDAMTFATAVAVIEGGSAINRKFSEQSNSN